MKPNREDVVQAALMVERWCKANKTQQNGGECDCPYYFKGGKVWKQGCILNLPFLWNLEEFLRTRGIKHDK